MIACPKLNLMRITHVTTREKEQQLPQLHSSCKGVVIELEQIMYDDVQHRKQDEPLLAACHNEDRDVETFGLLSSDAQDADRASPLEQPCSLGYSCVHRWASKTFFLFGSVLYLILAIWDVHDEDEWLDEAASVAPVVGVDDDGAYGGDDDELGYVWYLSAYGIISVLAPSSYLMDAIVSYWSTHTPREREHYHGHLLTFGVHLTFGLGALCDLVAAVISQMDHIVIGRIFSRAAVHIYLLNAALLLAGKSPSFTTLSAALEASGDTFFVVGSIVDVIISYFYEIGTSSHGMRRFNHGNLVSTILWFVDAILYILVDALECLLDSENACES